MKRLGISARFALIGAAAATLIVLPVLALSIVTTRTVEQQLVERGEAERRQTAQIAVAFADATLAGAASTLELLGRRAPVRDSLERGDQALLARVAADLRAGSAVKFTPPGGRVALRTWADGRDLHVEVADSGIGIPLDRQPRVFEVFGRVNEDRSDSSGTGLGLALTRQLVQLHSGSLTFRSAEGQGTTFTVVLPGVVPHPVVAVRGGEVLAAR